MAWLFRRRDKDAIQGKGGSAAQPQRTMADFISAAAAELEGLMAADPQWFSHLPYKGAMSRDQARQFEVEKRAVWRRVIHDAQRSDLPGLRWETRGDGQVCPQCRQMEGRVFGRAELAELNAMVMHLGCRCELVPHRS